MITWKNKSAHATLITKSLSDISKNHLNLKKLGMILIKKELPWSLKSFHLNRQKCLLEKIPWSLKREPRHLKNHWLDLQKRTSIFWKWSILVKKSPPDQKRAIGLSDKKARQDQRSNTLIYSQHPSKEHQDQR